MKIKYFSNKENPALFDDQQTFHTSSLVEHLYTEVKLLIYKQAT